MSDTPNKKWTTNAKKSDSKNRVKVNDEQRKQKLKQALALALATQNEIKIDPNYSREKVNDALEQIRINLEFAENGYAYI